MSESDDQPVEAGPCPVRWCLSRSVRVERYKRPRGRNLFRVRCECCGCATPQHRSRVQAIRQWNGTDALMVSGVQHWSDCASHNEPAVPAKPCNCGGFTPIDNPS